MCVLLDYPALRDFKGWVHIFGVDQPLQVDIGCGKDDSLIERAAARGEINFVGIENDREIAFRMEKKIRRSPVRNLRLLLFDAALALRNFFESQSVHAFSMQFPDPWPKRRHAKRRLLTVDFVRVLREKLRPGGEFFLATDVPGIARLAIEVFEAAGGFQNCAGHQVFERQKPFDPTTCHGLTSRRTTWPLAEFAAVRQVGRWWDDPLTLYEKKFLKHGIPLFYLKMAKTASKTDGCCKSC